MWKMHETWDGTYSFHDLLEAHDLLDFKSETEARVREASVAADKK